MHVLISFSEENFDVHLKCMRSSRAMCVCSFPSRHQESPRSLASWSFLTALQGSMFKLCRFQRSVSEFLVILPKCQLLHLSLTMFSFVSSKYTPSFHMKLDFPRDPHTIVLINPHDSCDISIPLRAHPTCLSYHLRDSSITRQLLIQSGS